MTETRPPGPRYTPKLPSTPADYLKGNTQTSPYPISAVVLECTWWESIPKLQKRRVISIFEYPMLNRGDVKKAHDTIYVTVSTSDNATILSRNGPFSPPHRNVHGGKALLSSRNEELSRDFAIHTSVRRC